MVCVFKPFLCLNLRALVVGRFSNCARVRLIAEVKFVFTISPSMKLISVLFSFLFFCKRTTIFPVADLAEDDDSKTYLELPFQVTLLGFDAVRDPCNRWTMKHVQDIVDRYKFGLKSWVRYSILL